MRTMRDMTEAAIVDVICHKALNLHEVDNAERTCDNFLFCFCCFKNSRLVEFMVYNRRYVKCRTVF